MRAARLHGRGGPLQLEDVPLPEPAGMEIRIRVAGCGVCHTDLHIVDGTQARVELPVTLGHEVAGYVDAFGPEASPEPGSGLRIGAPVLVFGGWGCGACRECRSGAEQRCLESRAPGFQLDGGYADAMIVPHPRDLVPLADLEPVRAAPLADAGVSAYRAVGRAGRWLVPGARVLQIGCGGLGQFALQFLRITRDGPGLFVAVLEADRRRMARADELGADVALLDAGAGEAVAALGGPADVVLDFVGTAETLATAAEVVAPDGLVVLVGEGSGRMPFGFDELPVESWLTTSAWGSHDDLEAVVRLAEDGRLRWTVETMPLADAAAAHERLRRGDVEGRLVLVPEPGR